MSIGRKIKSKKEQQIVIETYLAHIATGKSSRSFWYTNGDRSVCAETVEIWIKQDHDQYRDRRLVAYAKCFAYWEQLITDSATGVNKDVSVASLRMVMRNRFGWDKETPIDAIDSQNLETMQQFFKSILNKS